MKKITATILSALVFSQAHAFLLDGDNPTCPSADELKSVHFQFAQKESDHQYTVWGSHAGADNQKWTLTVEGVNAYHKKHAQKKAQRKLKNLQGTPEASQANGSWVCNYEPLGKKNLKVSASLAVEESK